MFGNRIGLPRDYSSRDPHGLVHDGGK